MAEREDISLGGWVGTMRGAWMEGEGLDQIHKEWYVYNTIGENSILVRNCYRRMPGWMHAKGRRGGKSGLPHDGGGQ